MRKTILSAVRSVVVSVVILLAAPAAVSADTGQSDLVIVPRIAYSYKTVSFSLNGKEIKPFYQTLDLGITAAYKAFYVSANYDNSVKDAMIHNTLPNGGAGSGYDDSILNMSREDWAVTLGYNIGIGFTVFGGYKNGTTTALITSNALAPSPPAPGSDPMNQEFNMTLRGPFLGAGYTARFSKGSLDISVAYAHLDPDVYSLRVYPDIEYTVVSGKASGFSYGVSWSGPSWSGPLAETAGYSVGLKSNRYRFRADVPPGQNDEASFDENHNIFYVSVSKYF